ncbi:MAG: endospore germination permease [Clostridia bacterium]|nr:endospore germination permease [Clostridia bacterium]
MEKLSDKDLTSILINLMYVKLLLAYPRIMIMIAGNASWILSIYVTLIMLLIFFVLTKAYNFSRPILETAGKSFGKAFKLIIGVITVLMLMLSLTSIARIYPETVKIILLQRTPFELIIFLFVLTAVIGAYIGIEAIGRITSLFLPIAGAVMIFCLILLFPYMKISNLTPILGKGVKSILVDGLTSISSFSDIIVIFILNLESKNQKKIIKCGYKSIIVIGIIMTLILLSYSLIFPANISENFLLPVYQLTRIIQIGDFFGRFEAFFEFVWSISVLLYFSIYIYTISIVWKESFGMKYHKPLIFPLMILIMMFVMQSDSYTEMNAHYMWYSIALISVSVLIPLITGIAGKIRIKEGNDNIENN